LFSDARESSDGWFFPRNETAAAGVSLSVHALAISGGAAVLFWAGWEWIARARPKTNSAGSMAHSIDELDSDSRTVLRAVAEGEPFEGDIPGMARETAQECLDRLSALGIVKCELTARAGEAHARTVWSVFPEFKEAALQFETGR
jgi:hypothetical protein